MKNNKYIAKFQSLTSTILNSDFAQFIKRSKKTIAILAIVAFFIFFIFYTINHPEIVNNVLSIGLANTGLIMIIYCGGMATNVAILFVIIRLCNKRLSLKNSTLLTIYSSIVNFFGPLQSGPVVRLVYLKRKIGLSVREYVHSILIYYFFYAAINGSLLSINQLPWLSCIGIITTIVITIIGADKLGYGELKKYVYYIFALTAIQIALMTIIYNIELTAISPLAHYSILQSISYTSSANLALFVSLTPGAIGFREAFLIISQSIHKVSLNSIIAAGIVDRAIYIAFLGLLFLLSSGLHLKNIFITKKAEQK